MDQNLTDTPIALTSPDNLPEHHAKGHAVIRHAPLYLLCQGANPVFRRNYGESSIDTDTTDPLEQEKITKTLEIIRAWQKERASKGEDPLRDFISWLPNFLNEVTLVGVDYPAELIFADPVRGVARPMNIGRHRKVIYITRRFLKRFLNTDETVELATFILHQMEWCFLFSTARENKESPEQIQNRLLHHTLNALRVDRYFSTVSPPDLDKRLRGSLRQHLEDEAVCVVPLYLSKIQELETLRTTLGTESPSPTLYHVRDDNRTVVFRVLKLTEQLGLMARAMGREEEAQFFFEQHTVWVEWFQRREGGLLPFNTRINLLRDLLTDNEYEKFYRTLKNFLVEKNFVHPPLDLNWADHLSVHMETFRQRDIPSIREMIEKSVETAEGLGNKEGKDWLIRAQRLLADYVQETRDKQRDDDDLPPPGNPFSGEPGSSVETKPNRLSLLKLKFLEYQSRPFYSRWVFLSLFKKTASKPFIVVVDVSPLFGPENNDRTALVEHLNALDTARRKTEGLGVFAGFYGTPPSKEEWLRQSDALDLPPKVVHFVTNKIITDQTINLLGSAQIIQATEVLEQALPKTGLSETEWKKLWSSQGCVLDLYAGRDAPVAMDDPLLHEFYILLKGLFVSPVRQIQEWQEKLSVLSQSA